MTAARCNRASSRNTSFEPKTIHQRFKAGLAERLGASLPSCAGRFNSGDLLHCFALDFASALISVFVSARSGQVPDGDKCPLPICQFFGAVAKRPCGGLQNRRAGFDSRSRLHAFSLPP